MHEQLQLGHYYIYQYMSLKNHFKDYNELF